MKCFCQGVVLQFSFFIFMPLINLWFIRFQGNLPILRTRSCPDLDPFIRPPGRQKPLKKVWCLAQWLGRKVPGLIPSSAIGFALEDIYFTVIADSLCYLREDGSLPALEDYSSRYSSAILCMFLYVCRTIFLLYRELV